MDRVHKGVYGLGPLGWSMDRGRSRFPSGGLCFVYILTWFSLFQTAKTFICQAYRPSPPLPLPQDAINEFD